MAEFTCPTCGHYFRGTACHGCVGNIKGYICSECGTRILNPFWQHEYHLWAKSNMVDELSKEGALETEIVTVP